MYNATIREIKSDGTLYSVFAGYIKDGKILRSNAIQCTGFEDTDYYDFYIRTLVAKYDHKLEIVMDECKGYKEFISELNLPPTYKTTR